MTSVQVAVAVIENTQGQVLITKRPAHVHMGGFWEFPGGKLEAAETVFLALQREIREELAIDVEAAEPMLRIPFQYPEKQVVLHVWRVTRYSGQAMPVENQALAWVHPDSLATYEFPPANRAILTALQLPDRMLITGAFESGDECLYRVQQAVEKHGIRCVQFRAHHLSPPGYREIAIRLQGYTRQVGVRLLLNTNDYTLAGTGTGLHLPFEQLAALTTRPVAREVLLGGSCHSLHELEQALALPVDFVTFSPVQPTATHPDVISHDWDGLAKFVAHCTVPVYALGGMRQADLAVARQHGAHGIAAISAWW